MNATEIKIADDSSDDTDLERHVTQQDDFIFERAVDDFDDDLELIKLEVTEKVEHENENKA